jgi:hydroxymethylpyrimidine pyrophosphatase-like HAD family hydrolase
MKAFFLDIDGTLVNGGRGPFPPDITAIVEARKAGHKVFLCTGRSLGSIQPALRNAPWIDGIVAGCGATVMLKDTVIHRSSIPSALLPLICDIYLKNGKWCVFEGETGVFMIRRCPLFDYGRVPIPINEKDFFQNHFPSEIITKITMQDFLTSAERAVFEPAAHINEFSRVVRKLKFPNNIRLKLRVSRPAGRENTRLVRKLTEFPHKFSVYSEAIVQGETKTAGMDCALSALGLERADAVAIGDSENDLDVVGAAGLGIAMGNAVDRLKAVAAFVTAPVGEGGVAKAVRYALDTRANPRAAESR